VWARGAEVAYQAQTLPHGLAQLHCRPGGKENESSTSQTLKKIEVSPTINASSNHFTVKRRESWRHSRRQTPPVLLPAPPSTAARQRPPVIIVEPLMRLTGRSMVESGTSMIDHNEAGSTQTWRCSTGTMLTIGTSDQSSRYTHQRPRFLELIREARRYGRKASSPERVELNPHGTLRMAEISTCKRY
jgi:hypothetical protein